MQRLGMDSFRDPLHGADGQYIHYEVADRPHSQAVVKERRELEYDVVVRKESNVFAHEHLPAQPGGKMVLVIVVEDRVQPRGVEKDAHVRDPSL